MSQPHTQPDPTSFQGSPESSRKVREARAARERLPMVWLVLSATIALVFVVGILIVALR